jgi:isopentenyl phosphate kinase
VTVVVKLGGSVVTEKDAHETVDEAALRTTADALAGATDPLVVVHGGGSFGHPNAAEYGVTTTAGTSDPAAVDAIHGAMVRLNGHVAAALRDAGLAAVPIHPFSVASRDAEGNLELPGTGLRRTLAEDFIPVLHGDLVVQEGEGATVLSGDELVPAVATAFGADRVGVCSTVPGVFGDDGTVLKAIESETAIPDAVGGSDATDVTGGMAGKLRQLLALDVPAQVFGPDALGAFLEGKGPGTRVGTAKTGRRTSD